MHYEFCTLFDSNYLIRGLSLYISLLEHCEFFHLWILCMDDECYEILKKLDLKNISLISLLEFEDSELLKAKKTRSHGEYCWTCTPSLCLYVLEKNPKIELIGYLDSDLFFYSSPEPIYKEFGDESIMIIPHRFSPSKRYLEKNGLYNVGMLIFRNNESSEECLKWWRGKCNKSCSFNPEMGILGDQKYLDEFPVKFNNVHILKHKGANLAPWNIKNYNIKKMNNSVYIDEDILIFYHFFDFEIYLRSYWLPDCPFSHYMARSDAKKYIYNQYIKALKKSIKQIHRKFPNFNKGTVPRPPIVNQIQESIFRTTKNFLKLILGK